MKTVISVKKLQDTFMPFYPWIMAARSRTLPAAVSPVLVGSGLAYHYTAFSPLISAVCLLLALLLQVACNYTNDLYDHENGADRPNRSGPKRAVASGLITCRQMRNAIALLLGATFLVIIYLSLIGGQVFFFLGVFCITAAVFYTAGPIPLGYLGLGDIMVFICFGLIAVAGTFYLQAGELTLDSLIAGTSIGALTTNILVINNTRDRFEDASVGKNTVAVRFGRNFCLYQYILLFFAGYGGVVIFLGRSSWVALSFLTVPMAWRLVRELKDREGAELNLTLARTANLLLFYSVFLAMGLVIGSYF